MDRDMTVPCAEGLINLRVGAIILQKGRLLMVKSPDDSFYYTIGGRIQFGETAQEAVVREVLEETGIAMTVDRLGFVHENYFHQPSGKLVYEIARFFYMTVPEDFSPVSSDLPMEKLAWVDLSAPVTLYPSFFRTELAHPSREVRYFITDER